MTQRIFAIITHHKLGNEVEAAELWKKLGICALGWPSINFCRYRSEEAIRERLKKENLNTRHAKEIWRFVGEINKGDLVLAYTRKNTIAYVGEVKGPCEFNTRNVVGNLEGKFYYPHQRKVKWWNEPHHFDRLDLPPNFRDQLGKHRVIVAEVDPGSKGFEGFIKILKACAGSGSKFPGINEDTVKAGLVKHLNHAIDRLEQGLVIKDVEIAIGKQKKSRPDFVAEDKQGRIVLIECKGTADTRTFEQIQDYGKAYGKGKNPRLFIVAFRITEPCRVAARKAGNIELFECDLDFHKI